MFREIKSNKFYVQTIGRILRMPEPRLKEDYKNNPNLRLGYLYTNYRREKVRIPDESLKNKPLVKTAKIKSGMKNIQLLSDYISRLDYGDIRVSKEFQKVFVNSLNDFFRIENSEKAEEQLRKLRLNLGDELDNKIIVDACFEDFDNLAFEFVKRGSDIAFDMSVNDIEKTFNYLC
jgi:type III restriction enzyme